MNRTTKFLYNSISTGFQQIIVMIAGFVIPRIMLSQYGSEINGLVSSINQFISYFNLVEVGIAGSAVYALYKPLADKDYKAINRIVSAAKRFYDISGYIFISLTIGLAIIYPMFVSTETLSPLLVGILVLVLGTSGTLEFFTLSKYRVLLTADQKVYAISIASSISTILNTVIIIICSSLNMNIVLLRGIALLSVFMRTIILYIYVKINYKYVNYKEEPDNASMDKRWDAFYFQILGSIHNGAPTIIATLFTSLKVVSVYSIFNMIMMGVNGILGIFVSGLSSSFGDIMARNDSKLLKKTYNEFEFSYYSILIVTYSILMILIMPFINIYTKGITDVNYNLPMIGVLFVINGLLYNLKTPQAMLIISAGIYKETRKQNTIQAVIAIVSELIFVQFWGLEGILLGSCLANLYRCIDLVFYIPKNVTKLSAKISLYRWFRSGITAVIILVPFFFININTDNYFRWLIVAFGVGIYAVAIQLTMSILFEKEILISVFNRIALVFMNNKKKKIERIF